MREHQEQAYHMTVAPIISRGTATPPTTAQGDSNPPTSNRELAERYSQPGLAGAD